MENRILLDKKEVLEILGITNNTLDSWERNGYIKRCRTPTVKYSRTSIEKLAYDGGDNLLIRKDREIQELRLENLRLRNKLEEIKGVLE